MKFHIFPWFPFFSLLLNYTLILLFPYFLVVSQLFQNSNEKYSYEVFKFCLMILPKYKLKSVHLYYSLQDFD